MTIRRAAFAIATALSMPPAAFASPPDIPLPAALPVEPAPGQPPLPPYLHGIQLSEEQMDKLFLIMHRHMGDSYGQAKQARKTQDALRRLSLSPDFDETKAKALADAYGRNLAESELGRARTDWQVYRLLSPEQRRLVDDRPTDAPSDCARPHRR